MDGTAAISQNSREGSEPSTTTETCAFRFSPGTSASCGRDRYHIAWTERLYNADTGNKLK